jgi:hypothetical protein
MPLILNYTSKVARGKNIAGLAALPVFGMAPRLRPRQLCCLNFHQTFQLSSSFINPTDSAPPYNTLLNMSTQGQGQKITFAPACIGTSEVDEEYMLRCLREELEDEHRVPHTLLREWRKSSCSRTNYMASRWESR